MKLALRYIPTEVWVDVFCYPWISRRKLGKIVHKFRNRKFAEILQYCLHERGKQTLGYLDLGESTDLPLTPMPDNIKFFAHIEIWHFNSSTLAFLRRISTLFTGVNLNLLSFGRDDDLAKLGTIFDHLAPLFDGIHSLAFDQCAIPLVEQHFGPKLAQVKTLTLGIEDQRGIDFCLNWLTSTGEQWEDSSEPRLLTAYICRDIFLQFSTAVQQQFHSAKTAHTFAIALLFNGGYDNNGFFHLLENPIGEQLHGQRKGPDHFAITRHQPNAGTALREWVGETVGKRNKSSGIRFFNRLTIGQIGANEEVNEHVKEEADPPSTSKKPKLT